MLHTGGEVAHMTVITWFSTKPADYVIMKNKRNGCTERPEALFGYSRFIKRSGTEHKLVLPSEGAGVTHRDKPDFGPPTFW